MIYLTETSHRKIKMSELYNQPTIVNNGRQEKNVQDEVLVKKHIDIKPTTEQR